MRNYLFVIVIITIMSCNNSSTIIINNDDSALQSQPSFQNNSTHQELNKLKLYRYSYYLNFLLKDSTVKAATGFIVQYKSNYYMVSCFHCFTNITPATINEQIPLTDTTPVRMAVFYMNEKETEVQPYFFDLFDKKTGMSKCYLLYDNINRHYYDIAIVPISKPTSNYFITLNDLDTNTVVGNSQILIIGYPERMTEQDGYKPEAFVANTIAYEGRMYIRYDKYIPRGTSGSPIYLKQNNGEMKIIGIASNTGAQNKSYKSYGFDIKYLQILLKMNFGN